MVARNKKKLFVLDTNVILHDSTCIYRFEEHDIVVPIPVLEELDSFKKGNQSVNFHAREFARALDELSGDKLFNGGVRIAEGRGLIQVKLERPMHEDLADNFSGKADHRILNIAYCLARGKKGREVILVSKDVNLRMKAKAVGILAEDYKTDQVKDVNTLYRGHRLEEGVAEEVFAGLYNGSSDFPVDRLPLDRQLCVNEYLVLRNENRSALGFYDAAAGTVRRVDKLVSYGINPRNAEQIFAMDALCNPGIPLVTITGKAGTGKTLLALAAGLRERRHFRQIFMARPVVPLSSKDIGYLPGDIEAKLDPYMQPLYDNLGVMQLAEKSQSGGRPIAELLEEKKLVVSPLAYIRGRSLVQIFFIVDEAQNLTPHEIKTIITRAGEGTKVVFTGDIFQIDHPYLDSHTNGLSYLIEKMQGQRLYAHINLEKGERSELAELASNLL